MISQRALNYAKIVFSMELQENSINAAKNLLFNNKDLSDALKNPVIKMQEKAAIIDKLFDKEISNFIKVLCENNAISLYAEIVDAYDELVLNRNNMIKAKLSYAMKPDEAELDQIKKMICDKYKKTGVFLELEEDASLIGGFVLYVTDMEYDKSIKGTLSEMQKTLIRR